MGENRIAQLEGADHAQHPDRGFNGDEFTLRADTFAHTYNDRGGGSLFDCEASSVSAYLRRPEELSGAEWEFTGLEPTSLLKDPPAVPAPRAGQACEPGPGPDPAAGELEFELLGLRPARRARQCGAAGRGHSQLAAREGLQSDLRRRVMEVQRGGMPTTRC